MGQGQAKGQTKDFLVSFLTLTQNKLFPKNRSKDTGYRMKSLFGQGQDKGQAKECFAIYT